MDRDDDGETSYKYNTFVDDVALEPTYLQALPTAAGRNVATQAYGSELLSGIRQQSENGWIDVFMNTYIKEKLFFL